MTVVKSQLGHQICYTRRALDGHTWVLSYGEVELAPAFWRATRTDPGQPEEIIGARRFVPDKRMLQRWLSPIIGETTASELAGAVDAKPTENGRVAPNAADTMIAVGLAPTRASPTSR
jgi:hypothetical protein